MYTNEMKSITITQYEDKMGNICFPDGFQEHLKKVVYEFDRDFFNHNEDGMLRGEMQKARITSIIQQMRCYGWSEFKKPVEWDDPSLVAETPDPELQRKIHPIMLNHDHIRLIIKKDMVVGVVLENAVSYYSSGDEYFYMAEDAYIFPYHGYAYSSTSDNNGAGYKNRNWYRYLICLPYNHTLW